MLYNQIGPHDKHACLGERRNMEPTSHDAEKPLVGMQQLLPTCIRSSLHIMNFLIIHILDNDSHPSVAIDQIYYLILRYAYNTRSMCQRSRRKTTLALYLTSLLSASIISVIRHYHNLRSYYSASRASFWAGNLSVETRNLWLRRAVYCGHRPEEQKSLIEL